MMPSFMMMIVRRTAARGSRERGEACTCLSAYSLPKSLSPLSGFVIK